MFVDRGGLIKDMLASGVSVRDVALRLGVATNTVAYHRDKTPSRCGLCPRTSARP